MERSFGGHLWEVSYQPTDLKWWESSSLLCGSISGRFCFSQSFRDPGSFHLVALASPRPLESSEFKEYMGKESENGGRMGHASSYFIGPSSVTWSHLTAKVREKRHLAVAREEAENMDIGEH